MRKSRLKSMRKRKEKNQIENEDVVDFSTRREAEVQGSLYGLDLKWREWKSITGSVSRKRRLQSMLRLRRGRIQRHRS